MRIIKGFLIPLLAALSILLSSCGTALSDDKGANTVTPDTTVPSSIDESNRGGDGQADSVLTEEYSYETWLENTYSYFDTVKVDLSQDNSGIFTDNSSTLAWGTSYVLDALYRSYCATGDIAFVDQIAIYLYNDYELLADKDGDGYLNWGTGHYSGGVYEEYVVHSGMMLNMAGLFSCLVMGDPELSEKDTPVGMTYRELSDYIIDRSVNHIIPSFDCDWNDELGVYMTRPGSSIYDGAEESFSLPHNQYIVMAATLINFAKVSPEHRDEYLYKAERMCETFSSCVKRYPNIGVVTWNYNDPLFDTDHYTYRQEDFSHGMLDVRAAITAYENGLVFSLEDIGMFAKTYDSLMFRETENYPALSDYVDGTGETVGYIRYEIYDLSVHSEKIAERGMDYMLYNGTDKGIDAPQVLAFHPDTPLPGEFTLSSPDTSIDSTVFLWQRTAHANYYRIEIAEDPQFENVIAERDKITNSSTVIDGLPSGTELYARVVAMNMKGESTLSNTVKFKTAE